MSRIRTRFVAAMASAVVGSALLSAPVAAVTPITFNIYVTGTCQNGTGQASTNFTVRLLAPNGDQVGRVTTTSNSSGYWYACFPSPAAPGDKVRATGGGADRTVTIPNLSMNANRVSDVVSGHWIAGTGLVVCANHYTSFNLSTSVCLGATSSGTGAYSVDFTSDINVHGYDTVSATYTSGSDNFYVQTTFPYMLVTRANAYVEGALNRGQVATLTLKTGTGTVRGSARVQGDAGNYFDGYFFASSGNVVLPRPADKVTGSFASDATITIPDITVTGVASTNVVSGSCMANRPYMLFARKADYSDYAYRYGTTDGSGHISLDLTADINLAKYDPLQFTCMYVNGDRIERDYYVAS